MAFRASRKLWDALQRIPKQFETPQRTPADPPKSNRILRLLSNAHLITGVLYP